MNHIKGMIGCHTVGRETIDGWIPDATPVEESIRLVSSSTGEIQDMTKHSIGHLIPYYEPQMNASLRMKLSCPVAHSKGIEGRGW